MMTYDPDPAVVPEPYPSRQALAWFSLFRLWIAFGLLVVIIPSPDRLWRVGDSLSLSAWIALTYAVLVLLWTLLRSPKWLSRERQVQIAVFLDIAAFTLLMPHIGVTRGGLLLAIAVAAGALLMEGRLSLLFASLATLGVLTQQVYAQLYLDSPMGNFIQAGLLGITFFTVAMLGHVLYRRIQETLQLAARRQVDIDDLSKLNEFIIHSMGMGVLVVDGEQRLRLMNGAAIGLLGLQHDARGEYLEEIAPRLAQWLDTMYEDSSAQGETGTISICEQELEPRCLPLGEGPQAGTLVFLQDKREMVREAQQIKFASLGRLTASIAHNIRNPLSSVTHAGQLLGESSALCGEDRRLLDIIRRNSRRIDDIIVSVLQLSQRNRAAPERIDLGAWLDDFCTEFLEAWRLAPQRLQLVVPRYPLTVETDPRHLRQILSNLCDNALKYGGSKADPVRIRIHAASDPISGSTMIEVADNGPGIDPDTAREIFNPFFSTSPGGTGLGLYIAKELSETNGARLQYIAAQDGGTCFRLDFST